MIERDVGAMAPWRELCQGCNDLLATGDSWWARVATDHEAIPRVDEHQIEVRLRGNVLLTVEPRGKSLQCRIAPEYLLRTHGGSRVVLSGAGLAPELRMVSSLEDFGSHFEHVRRRVCRTTDRRHMVLDRLFLRHFRIVAVDAPFPPGRADLVGVDAQGNCVFFLLRRYADADLRLDGPGGVAHLLRRWDAWLASVGEARAAVVDLVERARALDGRQQSRYGHVPDRVTVYPHVRLLVVDFDHAQRLQGLSALRGRIEDGLDQARRRDDMLCIGDPGNISLRALFSGI